jgi:glutamate N-acetyltransferase/amino-acid N-acetyltransferase
MAYGKTRRGVCTEGFKAYGLREGRYGVAVIKAVDVCDCVGVFTRNSVKAAPVVYTKRVINNGVQAVVANSGNANTCVPEGLRDAMEIASAAAFELGVEPENLAVSSTGIIGRRIDVDAVVKLARKAALKLASTPKASLEAAKAIMTTDMKPKQYSIQYNGIQVGAICKGAGMISPDMATMLCFITTNADLPRAALKYSLDKAVEESFNMIVVDGDMSTNDTVLLLSSRRRKCTSKTFTPMLKHVCTELAKQIAGDGEGASKFLEFTVKGARNMREARIAAKAVASSPLVKTAFHGENPNWGRITAAIGSKIKIDAMRTDITFKSKKGSATVLEKGAAGNLKEAKKVLKAKDIIVRINLNSGRFSATAWGCDLTPEYVKINAGYN